LSLKTWRTRKRLYYDGEANTWIKKVRKEEEFEESDSDHSSLCEDVPKDFDVFEKTSQSSSEDTDTGLTADQLKNWTNIFSLFALRNHLSCNNFECWRHFVLA